MATKPNLFWSHLRQTQEIREGKRLYDARYSGFEGQIPTHVLGGYANGWVEKGGAKIPVDFELPPELDRSGKALVGSIVEKEFQVPGADGTTTARKRKVLAERKEDEKDVHYLTVVSGLLGQGQAVKVDQIRLLRDLKGGAPLAHGSFNWDQGAILVEAGEGEGVDLDPTTVGSVKSELVKWGRSQQFLGNGVPAYIHREWRMPVGSMVLRREVDGRLHRYVSTKPGIIMVDATGLEKHFMGLEENRKREREAEAKARAAAADKQTKLV
jgi:hypothetical protein